MKLQQTLQGLLYAPLPRTANPVRLPCATDLVIHFRVYAGHAIFDGKRRLLTPPFDFFKWTSGQRS